jgi:peptidoglycan/xylan/chitin deacetylase (PgdA/CDA1 family)
MVTFDDAYADIAEFALPILLQNGFGGCVFAVTGLVGGTNVWDQAKGSGTLPLMSADQIRFWADKGIEFGAHSRSHEDLTALSPERLTDEVMGSKKDLEELLGSSVTSFAYPYGAHNEAVREQVRVGFDLGFSTTEGINFLPSDRHILRRNYVGPNDSLFEFGLNVRWGGRNTVRDVRFPAELNS